MRSVTTKINVSPLSYRRRKASIERSIGNGEVDSSILSGSTIPFLQKALQISINPRFHLTAGFSHFSYFSQNRPRKHVSTDTKLAQRFAFCDAMLSTATTRCSSQPFRSPRD
jgi:hypothetical protein